MTTHLGDRAAEDLTARARIRDAAMLLFAERGTDGTTVRDIARAAGVSAGLVRHHFGSKEGLRDACDSYALDRLMRFKEDAMLRGQLANPGFMTAAHPTLLSLYRYLARAMVDGSPAAGALFDEVVALGEAWLTTHYPNHTDDPHGLAAVICAMHIGMLGMHEQLSRALGADILGAEGNLRMAAAVIDVYSRPLLGPEDAARAHASIAEVERQLRQHPPTAEGAPR
jgi:AcrR family transcriptional regulator